MIAIRGRERSASAMSLSAAFARSTRKPASTSHAATARGSATLSCA